MEDEYLRPHHAFRMDSDEYRRKTVLTVYHEKAAGLRTRTRLRSRKPRSKGGDISYGTVLKVTKHAQDVHLKYSISKQTYVRRVKM